LAATGARTRTRKYRPDKQEMIITMIKFAIARKKLKMTSFRASLFTTAPVIDASTPHPKITG